MRTALLVFFAVVGFLPPDVWPQGNPLGSEFRVNTYTAFDQAQPSIATDSDGNFVVVWEQSGQFGYPTHVVGQRYSNSGSPLGDAFLIGSYGGNNNAPSVASDSSGNFVVVWDGVGPGDTDGYGVIAQRFASAGDPLGPEFLVNTYTTGNQRQPSVAADSLGSFVVVWQSDSQDQSGEGIFGQRYRPIPPSSCCASGWSRRLPA